MVNISQDYYKIAKKHLQESAEVKQKTAIECIDSILAATKLIIDTFNCGNKVLILWATFISILIVLQFLLGILNVILQLPLEIAVLHNAVAALLLLIVASLIFSLFCRDKT